MNRDGEVRNFPSPAINVLLVEEDVPSAQRICRILERADRIRLRTVCVNRLCTGLEQLEEDRIDVVLLSLSLSDTRGMDTFIAVYDRIPEIPIIVLNDSDDESPALDILHRGAQDCLTKAALDGNLLVRSIRFAIERRRSSIEPMRYTRRLNAGEEGLHTIIVKNTDGIVVLDRKGVIRFINPAAEALWGCGKEVLLGQLFGLPVLLNETTEVDIIRRDGKKIIAEMRVVEMEWEGEMAYLASLREISDRKRTEEALAWEADVNAVMAILSRMLLMASSLDEIADLVLDHAKYFTESALGFVGHMDPVKGCLVSSTLSRDIWSACRIPDKRFIFDQFSGLWGWVLHHRKPLMTNTPQDDPRSSGVPEGHIPIYRFLSAPAMIGERLVGQVALANSTRDYTKRDLNLVERMAGIYALAIQRKRTEDALRESEERFRKIFEDGPLGMSLFGSDYRFIRVNATLCRILGYTEQELLDVTLLDITHPEDRERSRQHGDDLFRGETHYYKVEKRYLTKDGRIVWATVTTSVIRNESGEPLYGLSMIEDITERKRAEDELKEAKESADAANRAKSDFLANMSHELRTPLNAILGFTELILDKKIGDLNELQHEYLKDVHQSGRHLLSLINDILDLAKVETGKLSLELSEFPLKDLLLRSLSIVKEKAAKHGIRLSTSIGEIPEVIKADERKLKQILYNLLSNAVKFTLDGGSIELLAHSVSLVNDDWILHNGEQVALPGYHELKLSDNKQFVHISLKDNGIGLKQENLVRIFNPFEQVDASRSRRYQGTGLGLSLTKKLVELHRGRIWAESKGEGEGSTFHVLLPILEP